jgi:CRP-like cAMP-binding protein
MEKIINDYFVGEYIIDENTINNNMYVLLEGEVEIFTGNDEKKIILGTVKATEQKKPFFGEMALFFDIKRTANVKALTKCKAVVIKNEGDLLLYFSKSPIFAINCFKELSQRLYNTTNQFKEREQYIKYLELAINKTKKT